VELFFAGRAVRGEAIITRGGLEGGAVYALSAPLREAIAAHGEAVVRIDLRPDISAEALERRLCAPRGKQSLATFLRKTVALAPVAVGLLHEATIAAPQRPATMTPAALAALIKAVPVRLSATAPLASAISTAGGIAFAEVDARFMLRRRPGAFVAGEMLDWEAPTGGYLLQAAFSTGAAAAHGALEWLGREHRFSALER
jgi:predicted flavoprotein YhiN